MNGANGIVTLAVCLEGSREGKMGAPLSGRLEDHGFLIIGIDAAVCLNGRRIDDKNIQMQAASSAAQAEHNPVFRRAA